MRIALVGPAYPFRGGIAHYDTLLYRALQERHEVKFVCFKRQYPLWLFPGRNDRDESSKVPLRADGALPLLDPFVPTSWWKVANHLLEFGPDMIILPWWTPFWALPYAVILSRARRAHCGKVLFLCHDVVAHDYTLPHHVANHIMLRQGQGFIVHSQQEAEALRRIVPHAVIKSTLHPSYADLSTGDITKEEARKSLALDGPVLLFFGFVRPYKGLHDLIEALPMVLNQRKVTLMVVGEFWEPMENYVRQAEALGVQDSIRIVSGYLPNEEIPRYFASADLVVLPYRAATGSGVVQLALGCGKPLLATRVGSMVEIIEDEVTGMLVPSEDPLALAEAILRFFALPPEQQAAYAQHITERQHHFSWSRLVACIEELAEEIGCTCRP